MILSVSALLAMAAPSSEAAFLGFDFNPLTDGGAGGNNAAVQTYMNNATHLNTAGTGKSVAVTGAKGELNYTGDGHVVGPVNGGVTALTLGRSDGWFPGAPDSTKHTSTLDTFLVNEGADRITMDFNFLVYAVSFDYEIFPNGNCPQVGTGCPNTSDSDWPDFKLETFSAGQGTVQEFRTFGVVPSVAGTQYTKSPNSGAAGTELAPQLVTTSGVIYFENGITKLSFIDWPVKIGIDNLQLSDDVCDTPNGCAPPPPVIPEPSSLLLMGSGLAGVLGFGSKGFSSKKRRT